jgi:hypothetical protein
MQRQMAKLTEEQRKVLADSVDKVTREVERANRAFEALGVIIVGHGVRLPVLEYPADLDCPAACDRLGYRPALAWKGRVRKFTVARAKGNPNAISSATH